MSATARPAAFGPTAAIWISDSGQEKLFAHDLATGERLPERDIALHPDNDDPRAIWSDRETMWVLDDRAGALFAYDLASGELIAGYSLDAANDTPHGLWSDGVSVWVSNHDPKLLFAYRLPAPAAPVAEDAEPQDLKRVRDEEFDTLGASNNSPRGIWSDGEVMYVADASDGKVFYEGRCFCKADVAASSGYGAPPGTALLRVRRSSRYGPPPGRCEPLVMSGSGACAELLSALSMGHASGPVHEGTSCFQGGAASYRTSSEGQASCRSRPCSASRARLRSRSGLPS